MQIEHFHEFIEFAQYCNLSETSRKINVSLSCLSRHLSELEHYVGFELYDRKTFSLTSCGKTYLDNLIAIKERHAETVRKCREASKRPKTVLRLRKPLVLGVSETLLIGVLHDMKGQDESFDFEIVRDSTCSLFDSIMSGLVDLAIFGDGNTCEQAKAEHGSLDFFPLAEEGLSLLVHKNNPLAQADRIMISDLEKVSLIIPFQNEYAHWRDSITNIFGKHSVKPRFKERMIVDPSDRLPFDYLSRDDPNIAFLVTPAMEPASLNVPEYVFKHFDEADCLKTLYKLVCRADDDRGCVTDCIRRCAEAMQTIAKEPPI
jgi:DNA-binding transcriptional LysR family regulator